MSHAGSKHVPNMCNACAEHVWDMSMICQKHVWSISNTCGSMRGKKRLGCSLWDSSVYPGYALRLVCTAWSLTEAKAAPRPFPRLNLRAIVLIIVSQLRHSISQSCWVETRSAMEQRIRELQTLWLDRALQLFMLFYMEPVKTFCKQTRH